jgi:hypothetical protein
MGESKLFWKHLSEAGLINDDISLVTTAVGAEIDAKGNGYVPPAKLGKGTFWTVGNHLGRNFYSLSKVEITSIDVGSYMVGHGKFTEPSAITPLEAYQIDTKMDDGLPATGSLTTNAAVIVSTFPSVNFLTAITKTGFVNLIDSPCANTITNSYKIATPAEADALTCRSLIINAGF